MDGSAEPVPGMIIFFDWDSPDGSSGPQDGLSDHTGIVQKVENGIVYTVEGNSGDSVRVNQYPGLDLFDLELMDDDERAEVLEDAGLAPDDFDF